MNFAEVVKVIYLVEDDDNIRKLVCYALEKDGYETKGFFNPSEFWNEICNKIPQLILLDIMLPEEDGLSVLKKLQANNSTKNVPVIMLTAKGSEFDKVTGLDMGADDYITKPFSIRELMARVKANLRKLEPKIELPTNELQNDNKTERIIQIGNLALDLEKIEARIDGKPIDITLKEFDFLKYLALKHGQAVTREELLKNVWEYDFIGDERTVDVLVRRLRQKINDDTTSPKILATKRGIGYYLKTDSHDKQRKD